MWHQPEAVARRAFAFGRDRVRGHNLDQGTADALREQSESIRRRSRDLLRSLVSATETVADTQRQIARVADDIARGRSGCRDVHRTRAAQARALADHKRQQAQRLRRLVDGDTDANSL